MLQCILCANSLYSSIEYYVDGGGQSYRFIFPDVIELRTIVEAAVHKMGIVYIDGCNYSELECIIDGVEKLSFDIVTTHENTENLIQNLTQNSGASGGYLFGVDYVLLNLGCHLDPIVPDMFMQISDHEYLWRGDAIKIVAYEPLFATAKQIENKPWLLLIPAAVSDQSGILPFYSYNEGYISSSLHTITYELLNSTEDGASPRQDGFMSLVPTVTMHSVLNSIPDHVRIPYLKTDMQGADFSALRSVGDLLRRIPWIASEVWHHNSVMYKGFDNDFCRHWLPHMTSMGYLVAAISKTDFNMCNDVIESVRLNAGDGQAAIETFCEDSILQYPVQTERYCECDILWVHQSEYLDGAIPPLPPVSKIGEFFVAEKTSHWIAPTAKGVIPLSAQG